MLLFVDNLTNVDFSFLDPARGIVGETWLANIRLHGELDEQSMVCDFGQVKKVARQWLDCELDHRLAVPAQSDRLRLIQTGGNLDIQWQLDSGETIELTCPAEAIALVDAATLEPETVAGWCATQLMQAFDSPLEKLELDFSTETIDGAYYHYSHGLKKHDGNCQRIAHGHRSRIDIWLNGHKAPQLEQQWAALWRDIYIGTQQDIVHTSTTASQTYYDFAYDAPQGHFRLKVPRSMCYIINTDTTVECLAQHIATELSAEHPDANLRVRAYEGINKGAEAFR
ncbi:6-carboxytetrahydropterin synthase [Gilvimarinus sp. SDUM040013]|uniref:6-carboxy-5,6,7,8-tetrahydropterin synthase n=1 Tax=Gilvimarinus gilvus TaxID=3058038 RepID=A0ABU4RTF9_9GAMM|nr:6-carboxytetrahydropterin synthase [Gilvimarinus sp. SDUM040013]MDO3386939.1 6-carboxytetrahydropterin synthase [Gilvimarinus sp. SDUM040013]MDX6848167.1 6-carboxytetrahydropterin synthase [Gilvimarinus sp. SDUM040013]